MCLSLWPCGRRCKIGVSKRRRWKKCAAPISTYWCFDWLIWPQLRQKVICQSAKGIAHFISDSTYERKRAKFHSIYDTVRLVLLYIMDHLWRPRKILRRNFIYHRKGNFHQHPFALGLHVAFWQWKRETDANSGVNVVRLHNHNS